MYGTSNNTAAAVYAEYNSSGSLITNNTPTGATNLTGVVADALGNVYMTGTTGGTPFSYSTGYSNNWAPTVWKNVTSATSQSLTVGVTTYTYGYAQSPTVDASGNIYAVGDVWTPSVGSVPTYWKLGTATELSVTGYSSYGYWQNQSMAVDGSGNVDATETTTLNTPTRTNGFFIAPSVLIDWTGATNAPKVLMSDPVTVQ